MRKNTRSKNRKTRNLRSTCRKIKTVLHSLSEYTSWQSYSFLNIHYMTSLDILHIVLSVCLVFLSVPLTMILWRMYKMLDRVEVILAFAERMVGYAKELEVIPMKIIGRFTK